jgi:hypothetical protein
LIEAKQGCHAASIARKELEAKTGKKVVTAINAKKALKEIKQKEIPQLKRRIKNDN